VVAGPLSKLSEAEHAEIAIGNKKKASHPEHLLFEFMGPAF
jgi:hypothetical protein